jgi:hypothetical protein
MNFVHQITFQYNYDGMVNIWQYNSGGGGCSEKMLFVLDPFDR